MKDIGKFKSILMCNSVSSCVAMLEGNKGHVCPASFCLVACTRLCLSAKECAYLGRGLAWCMVQHEGFTLYNHLQPKEWWHDIAHLRWWASNAADKQTCQALARKLILGLICWRNFAVLTCSDILWPPSRSLWETCLSPSERLPIPLKVIDFRFTTLERT